MIDGLINKNTLLEFRVCSKTTNHICDKQHATSLWLVVFDKRFSFWY